MTTLPMENLRRTMPGARNSHRVLWVIGTITGAILILIYSGTAWVWFRPVLHKQLINKYAAEYKFDPLWVMAIIKVESGFEPGALSHRGAVGLMQILPATAHDIAPEIGLTSFQDSDLRNPDINLHLGVYYLSKLARLFPDDDTAILAAYNAGPGITQQWRKGKPALDLEDIDYPETRRFVRHVEQAFNFLKMAQSWKRLFGIDHGN